MKTAISMLSNLPPLRREGNIIYFPGAWRGKAPDPPSFEDHREAFKGVDFGGFQDRILWALYHNRIYSVEELARTPAAELLCFRRIGPKALGHIRAALENNGIASEALGIPETAVTRQGN